MLIPSVCFRVSSWAEKTASSMPGTVSWLAPMKQLHGIAIGWDDNYELRLWRARHACPSGSASRTLDVVEPSSGNVSEGESLMRLAAGLHAETRYGA